MENNKDKILLVNTNRKFKLDFNNIVRYRYDVNIASDGHSCLKSLNKEDYWIVIVSHPLPDMNSLDLLRKIKETQPDARIIFHSENGDFAFAEKAQNAGADLLLAGIWSGNKIKFYLQQLEELFLCHKRLSNERSSIEFLDELISSSLDKPIKQKNLLDVLGMSRSTLYRYLKKNNCSSYNEYMNLHRKKKAKYVLEYTDRSVNEVAAAVGIQDPTYFCRWFKKTMSVTPLTYRRLSKERNNKLKIGVLVPLSGAYGRDGPAGFTGADFAVRQLAMKSGIELELYPIDTETIPKIAARKVWDSINHMDIQYFTGCFSSAVAQEVSEVIENTNALMVSATCGKSLHGEKLNNIFRWSAPAEETVRKTVIPLFLQDTRKSRWCTITPDYLFGHIMLEEVKKVFSEIGIEDEGNLFHPLGNHNFQSHIKWLKESKVQTVVLLNYGADTEAFLWQINQAELLNKFQFLVLQSNGMSFINNFDLYSEQKIFFGTQYWEKKKLKANDNLRRAWNQQYNSTPSWEHVTGYIGINLLAMAVEKSGSIDPKANKRSLEHLSWDGLTAREEFINPETHRAVKDYFLLGATPRGTITEIGN